MIKKTLLFFTLIFASNEFASGPKFLLERSSSRLTDDDSSKKEPSLLAGCLSMDDIKESKDTVFPCKITTTRILAAINLRKLRAKSPTEDAN